jgi:hypothetical protein
VYPPAYQFFASDLVLNLTNLASKIAFTSVDEQSSQPRQKRNPQLRSFLSMAITNAGHTDPIEKEGKRI